MELPISTIARKQRDKLLTSYLKNNDILPVITISKYKVSFVRKKIILIVDSKYTFCYNVNILRY